MNYFTQNNLNEKLQKYLNFQNGLLIELSPKFFLIETTTVEDRIKKLLNTCKRTAIV
jgi:hypothetical protein